MTKTLDVVLSCSYGVHYRLTTLNKPNPREVSTNDGIITQNISQTTVPTSSETKSNTEKL